MLLHILHLLGSCSLGSCSSYTAFILLLRFQFSFDIHILYILGQKSNDTNHCPYFQGTQCILELIGAHICFGRPQGTKFLEKCHTIIIRVRVICQYSIALNWNAEMSVM